MLASRLLLCIIQAAPGSNQQPFDPSWPAQRWRAAIKCMQGTVMIFLEDFQKCMQAGDQKQIILLERPYYVTGAANALVPMRTSATTSILNSEFYVYSSH